MKTPWTEAMSDGCTVPASIQFASPEILTACRVCRPCCVAHDQAYYAGGTEAERLDADVELLRCMIPRVGDRMAVTFFSAVRVFGGSHFGQRNWAGEAFRADQVEAP